MIPTEIQPEAPTEREILEPYQTEHEISILDGLILLLQRKGFIIRFVVGATVIAVIVSLLLPVKYEAKVVLLPPAQNASLASSLMGEIGAMGSLGSLAALAGGGLNIKNPADMYVSLLTSRTVEDALIQRFGLMQEYKAKRMSDARKELENRTTAVSGAKDGLIRVTVEDHDPKRAADIANGYIQEFQRLSSSLAITEAARRRLFFQKELQQTKENLTAAENAMTETEKATGVLQIDSQARALVESAAVLRAQVAAKQVQIEGMRSFAAEDNPELLLAKQELTALQAELQKVAGSSQDAGSDINLTKGRVTQAGMEYLRHYRELKYQETVYELLAKELEIAKLDEAREGSVVQVVDPALPPDRKSSPHRMLIVLGVAVLSFFFAIAWVALRQRFAAASELPENRDRLRTIRQLWRSKPA